MGTYEYSLGARLLKKKIRKRKKKVGARLIYISNTACKDEFRRSHSSVVFHFDKHNRGKCKKCSPFSLHQNKDVS